MNTNLNMQTLPIDRLKPAKYNPRKDLKPGDTTTFRPPGSSGILLWEIP